MPPPSSFRQFNRELLASLTLEPKSAEQPKKKEPAPEKKTSQQQQNGEGAPSDGPPTGTELVISCMKKALAHSISSISMPEKERPLNPATDFTFKAKLEFGPKPGRGDGDKVGANATCCGGPVKRQLYEDSDDDEDEDQLIDHDEKFTFTDHAPMCYRHIRKFYDVDPKQYQEVLCNSGWHAIPTPGKSTAQLFFCGQNWVVKTMTKEESKFLSTILHRYYYHVRDNQHTLLPHFVGHHSIYVDSLKEKIQFVIMQNVFATGNMINEKFDLKGSTVNRFATKEERKKLTCTKKDLDINRPIRVGPKRRQLLVEQIKRDSEFLRKAHIMDYSFLVGIHLVENPVAMAAAGGGLQTAGGNAPGNRQTQNLGTSTGAPSGTGPRGGAGSWEDGRCFVADSGGMMSLTDADQQGQPLEIYYVGIIDILQEYNAWKTAETFFQGIIHNRTQISSVHPKEYAARFYSFMSNLVV